jgi:hypothetical protein
LICFKTMRQKRFLVLIAALAACSSQLARSPGAFKAEGCLQAADDILAVRKQTPQKYFANSSKMSVAVLNTKRSPTQAIHEIKINGDRAGSALVEIGFSFESERVSEIDPKRIPRLLSTIVNELQLPICNIKSGCFERAEHIANSLRLMNLRSGRLYIYGNFKFQSRFFDTPVDWGQHTVAYLKIQGSNDILVLDTALSDEAMTFSDWISTIIKSSSDREFDLVIVPYLNDDRGPFFSSIEDLERDMKRLRDLDPSPKSE